MRLLSLGRNKALGRRLLAHFRPLTPADLTVVERRFPIRVRADVQRALDALLGGEGADEPPAPAADGLRILEFTGVLKFFDHPGNSPQLSEVMLDSSPDPMQAVPPLYEEVDIGEAEPARCLKNGLWLLEQEGMRLAVLLTPHQQYGIDDGLQFQVAAPRDADGIRVSQAFFERLEAAVQAAGSYRGKVLSLEASTHFRGQSTGLLVHRLSPIGREQVILPESTLALLERNVLRFVRHRQALGARGLSTKKGLLLYGPPGTGKTHTIRYLAGALPGHTTLLITAEQVGLLSEYMALARLLQPSLVVIEDVDLIARDRTAMRGGPCEEVMLNKLLNEMDGLKPDAAILFVLTTNRPEALELALASRPGRVDQAIEFPLPDAEGRTKLVRLYAYGLDVPDEVVAAIVERTEGVSASFIKELMRRAAQFQLERREREAASPGERGHHGGGGNGNGDGHDGPLAALPLSLGDVESAIEELLFTGGSLNRKLLGGRGDDDDQG